MHDQRIVSIQFISTISRWGYSFLKKIIIKRQDEKEYEISEADFPRLNLNDIEDMYLLKVQGKLRNLPTDIQLAFITSLLIFIRSIIIRERVEDLQLGVESYQKKLNLTKPKLHEVNNINQLSQYTLMKEPGFGFIYRSAYAHNCFMAYDEIHKFCDDTLKYVRDGLSSRQKDTNLFGSTRWNSKEVREVRRFIAKIEQRLKRRDHIRRLESYFGGRPSFPILPYQRPESLNCL